MSLPFFNQQQPIFILNHDNSALIFTMQINNLSRTRLIPIFCVFSSPRSLFLTIQGVCDTPLQTNIKPLNH